MGVRIGLVLGMVMVFYVFLLFFIRFLEFDIKSIFLLWVMIFCILEMVLLKRLLCGVRIIIGIFLLIRVIGLCFSFLEV